MSTGIHSRRRTLALLGVFLLVFLTLIGRMSYLQIGQGDWLAEQGFRYRMRRTPIQPPRGDITDRNGQPLVTDVVCESIFAQPIVLKNKPAAAQALAPILEMEPAELERRMSRPSYFEWLKRKVKPEVADRVRALNITGIGWAPEKCRFYPEGDTAVHALGISNLDHHGIEGLELIYDKYLMGKPGAIQCEYTARGLPMDGGECRVMPGEQGLNLRTTLDMGLQRIVELATEQAQLETNAKRVAIMAMAVETGEILALSQWPRYDPALGGNSDPALRRIFTVADTVPPGSIFKPITASAALQTGVVNATTGINDSGCIHVQGWPICNWDHKALGGVTIREVMAKSSNVGFATLGMWLGKDRFYDYHTKFGLNKPTGIDLPGEAVGQWIPKKLAQDIDLATQAYGQTLTVSPIQMLTAIAAIANDGKRMWPHLAKELTDANGNVVQRFEPKVVEQVTSPEVARFVQELMVGVVDTGTGKNARVAGYKVGGKTGTATKVINGKVARGVYMANFVGFAPYPDPKVAVLISVDEPQGAYYGGQIAAPIFGEVMEDILTYLDAPLSTEPPPKPGPGELPPPKPREKAMVPSIINLSRAEAERVARNAGFELLIDGDGAYITEQFPAPGSTAYKGGQMAANTLIPAPSTETAHVPDLKGKTVKEAAQLLGQRGLLIQTEGQGVVVRQEPAAGARVRQGTPVKLYLQPPPKSKP